MRKAGIGALHFPLPSFVVSGGAPMADGKREQLTYERPASSPVSRWQFRLLFLLVLLNLGITIQMAYAPGVTASAKQWWADYQQRRRRESLWRQAWNHAKPAGTLV